ncbi:hypothetical protein GCM10028807_18320 [Spirosoma daeguense]
MMGVVYRITLSSFHVSTALALDDLQCPMMNLFVQTQSDGYQQNHSEKKIKNKPPLTNYLQLSGLYEFIT